MQEIGERNNLNRLEADELTAPSLHPRFDTRATSFNPQYQETKKE